MTVDLTHIIEKAIESLHKDGIQPSIALIKTRLPFPAPIPLIIRTLQCWQQGKTPPPTETSHIEPDQHTRILELERQVRLLNSRLKALEEKAQAKQ